MNCIVLFSGKCTIEDADHEAITVIACRWRIYTCAAIFGLNLRYVTLTEMIPFPSRTWVILHLSIFQFTGFDYHKPSELRTERYEVWCGWELALWGWKLASWGWELALWGWKLALWGWELALWGWELALWGVTWLRTSISSLTDLSAQASRSQRFGVTPYSKVCMILFIERFILHRWRWLGRVHIGQPAISGVAWHSSVLPGTTSHCEKC